MAKRNTTYAVILYDENGQVAGYTKDINMRNVAIGEAKEWAKEARPREKVYVTFSTQHDGQKGFLNPGGNHELTGEPWN